MIDFLFRSVSVWCKRWVLCITGVLATLGSSMAWADTPQVVLYGVVDLGVSLTRVTRSQGALGGQFSGSELGMDSGVQSGSRWGMRGFEPLSDDLVARFVLESGINAQNGTQGQGGRAFGRQSTFGFSSQRLGETDWGRQVNGASRYFGAIDPFSLGFGQANMGASFGAANTVRYDNMVMVQTPDLSGWQALAGYSFNVGQSALYANGPNTRVQPQTDAFGNVNNVRAATVAVRYSADKLIVAASFDAAFASTQVISPSDSALWIANTNTSIPKQWILGAKYDLGFMQLSGAVGQTFDGGFSGQNPGNGLSTPLSTFTGGAGILFNQGYNAQSYMVGASIPIDQNSRVLTSWQMMQPKGRLGDTVGYATQSIVSLAYTYALSKRTNFYVWGSMANNFGMIATAKTQVVGAGIRHLF